MDTRHVRKPPHYEMKVVGKKIVRMGSELPKEVWDTFKTLSPAERNEYIRELNNAGWTLQSIGNATGVSRERIRQICEYPRDEETYIKISHLPIPELPTEDIIKHTPKQLEPEVLKKLLELKEKAFWVRGKGKANRTEAEEYTKLLAQLLDEGYTTYSLAKQLGVTHGAINFRLVRYGYKTSTGKTRAYRSLTHREKGE